MKKEALCLSIVLEHELGHLVGYQHTDFGLMADTLATGVRLVPAADMDLFFAGL